MEKSTAGDSTCYGFSPTRWLVDIHYTEMRQDTNTSRSRRRSYVNAKAGGGPEC